MQSPPFRQGVSRVWYGSAEKGSWQPIFLWTVLQVPGRPEWTPRIWTCFFSSLGMNAQGRTQWWARDFRVYLCVWWSLSVYASVSHAWARCSPSLWEWSQVGKEGGWTVGQRPPPRVAPSALSLSRADLQEVWESWIWAWASRVLWRLICHSRRI